jgi:hypothetical protein
VIAAPGLANFAGVDVTFKRWKCRFSHSAGCTEDHASASCRAFQDLNPEAKEKALAGSRLCLRHPTDAE